MLWWTNSPSNRSKNSSCFVTVFPALSRFVLKIVLFTALNIFLPIVDWLSMIPLLFASYTRTVGRTNSVEWALPSMWLSLVPVDVALIERKIVSQEDSVLIGVASNLVRTNTSMTSRTMPELICGDSRTDMLIHHRCVVLTSVADHQAMALVGKLASQLYKCIYGSEPYNDGSKQ